ncbi:MAG TPA: S8 family serine peptidase, partial [Flavisolibacter sp.]|nr:S8 family serine peptidase [Flavisolibacter sp.]
MNPPRLLLPGILLFISFSLSAQKAGKTIWLKSGAIKAAAPLSQQSIESFNKALLTTFNKSIALVQFEELPSEKERRILSAAGIELLSYVPDYAYTVAITAPVNFDVLKTARVKALLDLLPQQKMDEALSKGQLPAYTVKVAGTVDVRVMFPKTIPASEVLAHLAETNFEVLSKELQTYNVLDLRITASRLSELAASPYIEFVQAKPPPDEPLNLNSRSGSRANILNASLANGGKGLNGEGVVIGVGDNANIQLNTDFSGRVLASGTTALSAHGVHVTGTAAGAGILNELYRGYAPKAKIVSQLGSNIISRASVYIQDYNMVVTNNSYGNIAGCGTFGVYEGGSAVIDRMAFNHPKLLNVFAAGNSG